jgi:hypothetical protein
MLAGMPSAKNASTPPTDRAGRAAQLRTVWTMARQNDPRLPLKVFGPAVAVLVVLVVVGVLLGHPVYFAVIGVLLGLVLATVLFGRRATSSMYAQVEGQPGAAASVLQSMRGDWQVTPAVAFNKNMDLVHRVVGRPGVVLVGEGSSPSQLRALMTDQKRRIGRVAPDTPIHEVIVGDGDGQVPLRKLQQTVVKLPRVLGRKDVPGLEARLKAVGGTNVPLPKGPIPRQARVPRGRMR